ncbi:MAG: DNA mismatch repair protein MutS [Oscillospiraceae bacterium]|nr:DNA mismatch repair protein MutS [Oscillospiraceae bacterium]
MAMEIDRSKLSPMMQQYLSVKDASGDAIVFFRLGDFYEMFFDDAILVSKLLELTLTGRDCGLPTRAPMCGVPYHSADQYLKKLVNLGYRVAICEQMEDPALTKGLVERGIIRVVTPGTLIESSMLDESNCNYLGAVWCKGEEIAFCASDISTGAIHLHRLEGKTRTDDLISLIDRYHPSELLITQDFLDYKPIADYLKTRTKCMVTLRDDACFSAEKYGETVLKQCSADSLAALGISENGADTAVICGLFQYIAETQRALVGRFTEITIHGKEGVLGLDANARRNLELTETLRSHEKKGSLLGVLDHTETAMGRRMLRTWMEQPLTAPVRIMDRLNAVELLMKHSVSLTELRDLLDKVFDLERLMSRVMFKKATPRDLKSLSQTALQLPDIKEQLRSLPQSKLLTRLESEISPLNEISDLIERALVDEPPIQLKDGGVIRDGFHQELDTLRHAMNHGADLIAEIEERERERTGIKNLKTGYNRVFGYYLEVSRSYYEQVPQEWIRKQTLTNCERYITQELRNAENTIVGAKDKALALENVIFNDLRDYIAEQLKIVQETASAVAQVDVLCSLALTALENEYCKPEIAVDGRIEIHDGRHPVVEQMLTDTVFVPNDVLLDCKSNRLSIITGPNMSGKSTYMRQTALIVLMAQMGSFVPASYAKISVVDQIFTRVGASDDLTAGESTFMVEMHEVSTILKRATANSLVILDEVGRGTSTFDGISIARAVAEFIAGKKIGCKTLFATHYHELTMLEHHCDGVRNLSIAVKKHGDTIRFLRKIVEGAADDSYGIEVAKLAGLPSQVTNRARALLTEMEAQSKAEKESYAAKLASEAQGQMSFAANQNEQVISQLSKTNVSELSDQECRELLMDLTAMLR